MTQKNSTRLIDQKNILNSVNPKLTRVFQSFFIVFTFQPSSNRRLFKLEILTWPKIPGHYSTRSFSIY